jgi:hypothetical protein
MKWISRIFLRPSAVAVRLTELCRTVDALPNDAERIRFLVRGVSKALELASAAFFASAADGGYVRQDAVGWPPGTTWHLLATDLLVQRLHDAGERPLRLAGPWPKGTSFPHGLASPTLAVPIVDRRRTVGVILYGAHNDGTQIDSDEAAGLLRVCNRVTHVPVHSKRRFHAAPDNSGFARALVPQ